MYEHELNLVPGLKALDSVTLLPHVGSATLETRTKMARLAAENLLAGLGGQIPPNDVNSDPILCKHRLGIFDTLAFAKCFPDPVTDLVSDLSEEGHLFSLIPLKA